MKKPSKYEYLYAKADTHVVLNEDDSVLDSIRIRLPKCPPLHTIRGYGLPPSEQKWKREEMPPKLAALNKKRYADVEQYWQEIEQNYQYYKDELPFIERQWKLRLEGLWIFINGKPTYMPPWHWWYLQEFQMDSETGDYAEYRSRDRIFFYACHYAASTTKAWFKYKIHTDKGIHYSSSPSTHQEAVQKGWQIENKGYLVDMGIRTIIGLNYPKLRREGATTKTQAIQLEIITRMKDAKAGIQSMTETHAQTVYDQYMLKGWRGLSFYFIPINEGLTNPQTHLRMQPKGKTKIDNDENTLMPLYSSVTPKSSSAKAFDTWKLKFYHADEVGKCFGIGTPILMADNSVKMVEDIKKGDKVMGESGQPKTVSSTTVGYGKMYAVKAKTGEVWCCNYEHILSLKWCRERHKLFGKHKKGDVVNIPVSQYLKMSKSMQKHLMLYKSYGVKYKKNNHLIDPYMIGLWLGDGRAQSAAITTIDKEIIEYINEFAKANGMTVKLDGITHRITTGQVGSTKNILANELKRLNLIENKHMPKEYLLDSRKNRLALLAGLLDSDGHKGRAGYEIIQKKESIAKGIIQLARSLGFNARSVLKKATMRRHDGTMFESMVHRIGIYGADLSIIPCKVERKKFKKVKKHINGRNPLHTGFSIDQIEDNNYYGFTLDAKDKRFLLADYTVAHNTEEVDVHERHYIVKKTLTLGGDANIVGLGLNTSTVEDMDKGGANFLKICKESHYRDRDETGQTLSGYINFFIPADEGLEGFIDEFGNSKKEQARRHILAKRKKYEDEGKSEDLIKEIRRTPLSFSECFTFVARNKKFDIAIINKRLQQFAFVEQNPAVVRGKLEYAGWPKIEKYDIANLPKMLDILSKKTYVRFVQTDEDWDWEFSYIPKQEANNFYYDEFNDAIMPGNKGLFRFGIDMYKYADKTTTGEGSLGCGAIYRNFNPSVDNPLLPPHEAYKIGPDGDTVWKTDRFCGVYLKRPDDKNEFCEQMLMAAILFGTPAFPEINVPDVWDWFGRDRGFYGYLLHRVNRITGRVDNRPGAATGTGIIKQIWTSWAEYIKKNGLREHHLVFLEQCRDIIDSMNDFDAFAGGGYALIQDQESFVDYSEPEVVDLSNFVRKYKV